MEENVTYYLKNEEGSLTEYDYLSLLSAYYNGEITGDTKVLVYDNYDRSKRYRKLKSIL